MLKTVCFFLFFICYVNNSLWASPVPPHQDLKTISTQHFEILYYAEQQELAEHYAVQFETAWKYLDGVYLSRPHKLTVVLNDSTDQANGFATRIPYPFIMLFPVLPDLNDSISEFENWSLELAVHELAHALSFEPAGGVMKPLRSIFGTIISPNLLLPGWWKEGFSVWTETAIGNAGRLRSIYQESILRSWVGTKNFNDFTIGQANETLPTWPWGSRPYFFGSMTMAYLIQKHGESVMQQITEKHGSTVPYMYDRVTKPLTSQTYEEIYQESLHSWEQRAVDQVQKLSQVEFDKPEKVKSDDVLSRSPTISADGQFLAWISQEEQPKNRLKLALLNPEGRIITVKEVKKGNQIKDARFFPKSQKILYSEIKPASQVEYYSDLYIYDVQKNKSERLTKKLRGREAQVSPRENEIVFVGVEGGRTALKTYDLKTKMVNTLFTSQLDERIATPLYLNDDEILYSFLQKGKESLFVWNRKENRATLFSDKSQRLRRPQLVGSNLWVMSDENRVFNLYNINNGQLSSAKTHVKSSIIDYVVNPANGSAYAVVMDPAGPLLYYFSPESLQKKRPALPNAGTLAGEVTRLPKVETAPTQTEQIARPYKLWPHYWIPFISGSSASNGLLISVSTSGQDPSMQHIYGLGVVYDTALEEASYSANYMNHAFSWPWTVLSVRQARSFAGVDSVYYNDVHAFAIMPDTMKISDDWGTSLAYLSTRYKSKFEKYERQGPQATFSFNNAEQTIWMISPETGGSASVSWAHFFESSRIPEHNQYRLQSSYYFSKWLPEHHAISLEGRALLTDRKIASALGDSSTVYSSGLTSDYLIRGFLESQFVGRNILNANLEYRFPFMSYSTVKSLFPFFLKRVHGALVADAIAVDGYGYNETLGTNVVLNRDRIFASGGAEIRADTTVGYVIPVQFVFGLHQPFQDDFRRSSNFYIQIKSGMGF